MNVIREKEKIIDEQQDKIDQMNATIRELQETLSGYNSQVTTQFKMTDVSARSFGSKKRVGKPDLDPIEPASNSGCCTCK